MIEKFSYEAAPGRVVFGAGALRSLSEEVRLLGLTRIMIVTTDSHRSLANEITSNLDGHVIEVFAGARVHVPVATAEEARAAMLAARADGIVALGGGSAVGLGKAIALTTKLPLLAIPTTYAGSEMTPIWGLTNDSGKLTGRDPAVLPRSVIYDPELSRTLPVSTSVVSGFNAVAHAIEGMYAPDLTPVVWLMAREGVSLMLRALPAIHRDWNDLSARSEALTGAWLCGATLGVTTMGLHHKICHVLGGTFDLPHAESHTAVLPHVLAFNAPAIPEVISALREVTDSSNPAAFLQELSVSLGAPRTLASLGFQDDDIERAVELIVRSPYANPRAVDPDSVRKILHDAQRGQELAT